LKDPGIAIIGYPANFKKLTLGVFDFDHSCKGTLAVGAADFRDLHDGKVFSARATGTEHCKGYCLKPGELKPCSAHCECRYIREIIQIIKNWPREFPGEKGS
jgi:hypothetical protein